jgi:hypothetical protein
MTYLDESGKAYTLDGKSYPRVTGILACTAKPALVPAAVKVVTEHIQSIVNGGTEIDWIDVKREYRRQWDRKATTGTLVHEAVSAAIAGQPVDPDLLTDEQHAIVDQFYRWQRAFAPDYLASEFAVFSDTYEYAGTADMAVRIDGRTYLVDVKTGKDLWPDVALQLAAYANADFYMVGKQRVTPWPFDEWAVLHLRSERWEFRAVRDEYRELAWRRFRALREVAYWTQHEGQKVDQVLGDLLLPTETFIPEAAA